MVNVPCISANIVHSAFYLSVSASDIFSVFILMCRTLSGYKEGWVAIKHGGFKSSFPLFLGSSVAVDRAKAVHLWQFSS